MSERAQVDLPWLPLLASAAIVWTMSGCESFTSGAGLVCRNELRSLSDSADSADDEASNPSDTRMCGRPVSGAEIRIDCPGPASNLFDERMRTDDAGRFQYSSIPAIPVDCTFVVEREGFETQRIPVRDACDERYFLARGECRRFELRAPLEPE